MEWTREKTLALIQEYRKRRGLWDMTHDDYRKKDVKHKLLVEVSDTLGNNIPITEIEKKFHTLRTQYHREINRMKRKEPYNSKWFGFKYLQFLSSPKACRSNKGRIKTEITEEGTVTTKYIIREVIPPHDIDGNVRANAANENDEFLSIQRVPANNGCSNATSRTRELEKLIEETTKDVEDIEDSKTKMSIKEIAVTMEQSNHDYSAGELQITSVDNEQENHNMQDVETNVDSLNIHTGEEEIAYQGVVSNGNIATATVVTGHNSSINSVNASSTTTTVHTIPARIIKIQRRDTNHDNGDLYEGVIQQRHGSHVSGHGCPHNIHTLSPTTGSTNKRIYYDTNGAQHTATILASTESPTHSTSGGLTLLNASAEATSPAPSFSKIHVRNNLTANTAAIINSRDEYTTYGEYVANEMRAIKTREILISLKHKINIALFDASMAELQK